MFKKLSKWFTRTFNKLTGSEPEPLVFDFKREPDIRQEYESQGFDDYYCMHYYGVCSSYRQKSPEIKYVHQQIKELFKHLELGVEYQYELILTRDIPKEQYTRYFNDVEIKKQYYLGHHVYIFIAFNQQLIKENGKDTFDYWVKYRRLDRNLEIGFMVRHRLVTWMEQKRSIDIAGDRHEFKFELDFNDFDKNLYFNQDLQRSYLEELKGLIRKDIDGIEKLEYPSIMVQFKSTTIIEVEIECGKYIIRNAIEEWDQRLMDMITHNVKSLYTDKYFYRNLINQNKE
nr:MAG TPA: hypothetical protein [Bacteriophage sp.]